MSEGQGQSQKKAAGRKKRGAAAAGEAEDKERRKSQFKMLSFRVDEETWAAVQRLEAAVPGAVKGNRRSIALRQAIVEADGRLALTKVEKPS